MHCEGGVLARVPRRTVTWRICEQHSRAHWRAREHNLVTCRELSGAKRRGFVSCAIMAKHSEAEKAKLAIVVVFDACHPLINLERLADDVDVI